MKTADFLKTHNACRDGAKWALSVSKDMSDVWDALVAQCKLDWLLWTLTRPGVFSDSILLKLACRVVRETPIGDGKTVWDLLTDERSKKAIEVTEAFADGRAADSELENAAADAARAAAYAAAHAAAHAAVDAAHADAAYAAAAAADAARAADAAYAAADAARAAASFAAESAAESAAEAAYDAAYDAQVQMIAELGNPFKEGIIK